MMTTPMTRDESVRILGIEKAIENIKDDVDHAVIMERFEEMFSKNDPEKGGSFYLQSKIYFAKVFLMQDHPTELNESKYNPDENFVEEEETAEDDANAESKEESKEDPKAK